MSALLAVCAIAFSSQKPIPYAMTQIYHNAFNCPAVVSNTPRKATAPIVDINHYFPANANYWPVLYDNNDIVKQASSWSRRGIHCALFLPADPLKIISNSLIINRLLAAQRAGALPIASLSRTTPSKLRAARYVWCMLGICPAGWYLKQGLNANIDIMPKGVYVAKPYWTSDHRLPLPSQQMNLSGHIILPLYKNPPEAGGVVAVANLPKDAHVFSPYIDTRWRWLDISFRRNDKGLHTNIIGWSLLATGAASMYLWSQIGVLHSNLLLTTSTDFGWLAFGLAVLNLVIIVVLIIQRKTPKNGKKKSL